MSAHLQDFVELLTAEQHVQLDRLRELAKNGIAAKVRGEVWLYLLDVMSPDKTSEMTSLKSLRIAYEGLPLQIPPDLTSLLLKTALEHHTRRFENPTYASLISDLTAEQPMSVLSPNGFAGGGSSIPGVVGGNVVTLGRNGGNAVGGLALSPRPSTAGQPSPQSLSYSSNGGVGSNGNGPPPLSLPDSADVISIRSHGWLPPAPSAPPSRHAFLSLMEDVLGRFWNAHSGLGKLGPSGAGGGNSGGKNEYGGAMSSGEVGVGGQIWGPETNWVYLCTPFICCLSRPVAVYYGFKKLIERIETFPPLPSRLGTLLGLFRLALPELHEYFEDEQVPMYAVAVSWLTTLLSREMWLGDVLRLWDAYLASDDMFSLHCYVCVAILSTCKETLEELDGSEAKLMLLDLPPMDVDRASLWICASKADDDFVSCCKMLPI